MPSGAESDPADPALAPGGGVPPVRLVVVRHGATEWSQSGRHTGRTDLPLLDEGRQQARELGRRLGGHHFSLVLTSPLRRARETCELAGFGPVVEECQDLREWDYGDYEGRTTDEIRSGRPGWSLWRDGVPGGETAREVGDRADRVIAAVRAQDGDVLAIAHAHVLRVVAARWVGLPAADGALLTLSTATISVLGWEREVAVVNRWNDAAGDVFG
jgi:probable phosphoglycerate mutase